MIINLNLEGKKIIVESAKNLETSGGYAKELDQDEKKKQEELLKTTIKTQDISEYIDWDSAKRINTPQMRVSVDFPKWMITALDQEANHLGLSRQALFAPTRSE